MKDRSPSQPSGNPAPSRQPQGALFHNPSHFVPVKADVDTAHSLEKKAFVADSLRHGSHASYAVSTASGEPLHSGRLICRLTTVSPMFIGAQRIREGTAQEPAVVAPFELEGQPAIPATSLRGLLSSLAEAASNSALRVLTDSLFSYRKNAKESLRNIGMVIKKEENYQLTPLEGLEPKKWRNLSRDKQQDQRRRILEEINAEQADGSLKPINKSAIERFEQLFNDRLESMKKTKDMDELLKSSSLARGIRNRIKLGEKFRLEHGDIVYYNEQKGKVIDIALSQIWRGRVEYEDEERKEIKPATAHCFFREINKELLPFNKDREWISPAEWLFGFVEERKRGEREGGLAYAGRVRVSFGRLARDQQAPYYQNHPVTLKILSSPKPPQPAFYFKFQEDNQNYIAKAELKLEKHIPQGRKIYLHHPETEEIPPWETQTGNENAEQKVTITPLEKNLTFYFHIDFDNLTSWELGLLCFALQPFDTFYHKLGMGKPLGLGTVRIESVGLFGIDRISRYRERDLFRVSRYHMAWVEDATSMLTEWPDSYAREKQEYQTGKLEEAEKWTELRDRFAEGMDEDIKNTLKLLGDPANIKHPVHTPQLAGFDGPDLEKETYRWFVDNESTRHELLHPLDGKSELLPMLTRHPKVKK